MAMRGGAKFSVLAPAMFARRALSQSLAREFGPKGVHVAHVIVDGHIDPANEGKVGNTVRGRMTWMELMGL